MKFPIFMDGRFVWLMVLFCLLIFRSGLVFASEVPYSVGSWDANALGNHRAIVKVTEKADAVGVHIPWRRRDRLPQEKNIILIDDQTGKRISNMLAVEVKREFGYLVFQPLSGPGDYYVYYLPYIMKGRNYPEVTYPPPEETASAAWRAKNQLRADELTEKPWTEFPQAQVMAIQAIDEFNSFYPMEVIATAEETEKLLSRAPQALYLLFPEDRKYPIRMTDDLPSRWIKKGPQDHFRGRAARGEFYVFQIGLFACRPRYAKALRSGEKAIDDFTVQFTNLTGVENDSIIPASALGCFNTGGIDWTGKEFKKKCPVEKGEIQALWCGVQIPRDLHPGVYTGEVIVIPQGLKPGRIRLTLNVTDEILSDAGDSEPARLSRLRWLDSKIALDDEIVAPFTPLEVKDNTISCLGRSVRLAENGLPARITSRFAPEVTHLTDKEREILAGPFNLVVEDANKSVLSWKTSGTKIIKKTPGVVTWQSSGQAAGLTFQCKGRMECDGFVDFTVEISALETTRLNDIRLEIPLSLEVARYMMGMGVKGGYRPEKLDWQWDPRKNQDALWLGDVNAGLQCSFRDENYSRPLNTNFYHLKPLKMPRSWYNEGKGGCTFKQTDSDTVLVKAYSGSRTIMAGEVLYYNFNLLVTPFKTLDTTGQWSTRFYHAYKPLDEIAEVGANTVNIHHATDINPYINYPFLRPQQMKDYVEAAHAKNMKVKIYYTVRELAHRAPELFALRSLGNEILAFGPGGGCAWLQEHLGGNYIAGWFVRRYTDAAVINSGVSRWHNYYLEGLDWLTKNVGIDGIYIDDVAFDRTVMKRVRKILDRNRPGALIDLHSANQYNVKDGFINSACLYLEHFPYINRLWFGEYFDYDASPDYWLIEVSGIPFGLMGEMLQEGGNPWRGMIYGMTARMPWAGNPGPMWKLWDEFGMAEARMIGYWSPSCPVKTSHKEILATAYVKKDQVLISLASWAPEKVNCSLRIDGEALGINLRKARLHAPAIEDFQDAAIFAPDDEIPVEPGRGWLLILH